MNEFQADARNCLKPWAIRRFSNGEKKQGEGVVHKSHYDSTGLCEKEKCASCFELLLLQACRLSR